MSRGDPGYFFHVEHGVHAGQYCIAPHSKQHEEFKKIKKLFVRFYHDIECSRPVMLDGKKVVGLISPDMLKACGMVD